LWLFSLVDNLTVEFYLDPQIKHKLLDHVSSVLPEEGCGLLAGKGLVPSRAFPVTNRLHSPVRFEMEPVEQLNAMLWAEENGLDIVAIYHSHPLGPVVPSPTDLSEFAYPGVVYLILSRQPEGETWQVRAFQIRNRQYEELSMPGSVNNYRPGGK
jgi:proteasome lid subunit RPN8/RPN11